MGIENHKKYEFALSMTRIKRQFQWIRDVKSLCLDDQ